MIYQTQAANGAEALAAYYLQNGNGTHAYRYFGVHRLRDVQGWWYVFRVAAPSADKVSLVGEWDNWEPVCMHRLGESGVWELVMSADLCPEGLRYKYLIQKGDGLHYKADPYARKSESGGEGASFICTETHYVWQDAQYLADRAQRQDTYERYAYPMNVYEVELSTWLGADKQAELEPDASNYRSLADLLSQYTADMGYTHVLLHSPCRQRSGKHGIITFFAPDAALGAPDDFAYFVDRMHKAGIGVITELECNTPGTHAGGLINFDGGGLYTAEIGGQAGFSYSDPYATTLLYSAATFWLREFHVDGLFVNACDMPCNRQTGDFVRSIALYAKKAAADALLLIRAESCRGLSAGQSIGGLGYDFVIDPRVENALLECFCMSDSLRVGRQAWLDPARYLYGEDGMLALSSAIPIGLSRSVMGSLFGSHSEKFAAMRTLFLYMICLPGKKLSFMGNEIGQITPWSLHDGVEWFMQEFNSHKALREYVKALNRFYLSAPPLWECDYSKQGLCALPIRNAPEGVIAFKRYDRMGREACVVLHFGKGEAKGVRVAVGGRYPYYRQAFTTLEQTDAERMQTDAEGMLTLDIQGVSGVVLEPVEPSGGFWFENV